MKIGIIGKGYFGKKIYNTLKEKYNVIFFTGREMKGISYNIDWVVIASSNSSHYDLCKKFIQKNVNVFVEKPMTTSYKKSVELVELAKHHNVLFYVDDIFLFHPKIHEISSISNSIKDVTFSWVKYGSFSDNIYNNLVYHDIYLSLFLNFSLGDVEFIKNHIHKKSFRLGNINFSYNRIYEGIKKKKIIINQIEYDLYTRINLLDVMFNKVFNGNVDYDLNIQRSLKVQQIIEKLYVYKPTVAVVGAGIFGITAALSLNDNGLSIDLFEKNTDILQNASSINQYRLHRGFHYPRSHETAISAKYGTHTFLKEFPCETQYKNQHYAISKRNSKVNSIQYQKFMDIVGIKYTKVKSNLINKNNIEAIYSVDERLFSPKRLYSLCDKKLKESNVNVKLDTEFKVNMISKYDYTVVCTYSNINTLLPNPQLYQFEVCEKPIAKLPDNFKGVGIVVMDGPFMCIDPYEDTEFHVLGNVVHAIHS